MFRVASRTKFSEPRDDCVGLLKLYGNEMVLVQTSMFLNERSKFSNRIIPGFTCLAIPKNKLVTLSKDVYKRQTEKSRKNPFRVPSEMQLQLLAKKKPKPNLL